MNQPAESRPGAHAFHTAAMEGLGGDAPDLADIQPGSLAHHPFRDRLHAGAFALLTLDGRAGVFGSYGTAASAAWLWHKTPLADMAPQERAATTQNLREAFTLALSAFQQEPPWWFCNLVRRLFGPVEAAGGMH